jgi:hypothetical protein
LLRQLLFAHKDPEPIRFVRGFQSSHQPQSCQQAGTGQKPQQLEDANRSEDSLLAPPSG